MAALADVLAGSPGRLRRALTRAAVGGEARPFRGLASFQPEHTELFFGREEEEQRLAQGIRQHGIVTLTGPSGVGKSSLLRAGVARHLPGWHLLVMRPGSDPVTALERAMANTAGPRVLVVDQAEEMLTLSRPESREPFGRALVALADAGEVRVVLSVRGDFFARIAEVAPLRGRYARSVEVITAPDTASRIRTLVMPAALFGYTFEDPALPREMAEAVSNEPAALALLQFCADQLWDQRDLEHRLLTRAAFETTGGVEGALAAHADRIVGQLPASQQGEARRMFLRLVTSERTRDPRTRRDLLESAPDAEEAAAVLDRLTDARLLSVGEGEGGDVQVELVHEALIRHWGRLAEWLNSDQEGQRMLLALGQAARTWQARDAREELLWRGGVLQEFQLWRARAQPRLTVLEDSFVTASDARERRAARVRRVGIASLIALLAIGALGAVLLWQRAEESAEVAEASADAARLSALRTNARLALGQRQDTLAIRLALAAWERAPGTPESRSLLYATLADRREVAILDMPEGTVGTAGFSADGRRFNVKEGGEFVLYDTSLHRIATLSGAADKDMGPTLRSFSADSRSLLTGGGQHPPRVWNAEDGSLRWAREDLRGHWVHWSGDGQLLAIQEMVPRPDGDEEEWRVFDLQGNQLGPTTTLPASSRVQWHPDGRQLLLASNPQDGPTTLELDRVGDGLSKVWRQTLPLEGGHDAAWDPSGARLLIWGDDGALRFWDPATARLATFAPRGILGAGWSPDGTRLQGLDDTGRIRLWDARGRPIEIEQPPNCAVTGADFSPDSQLEWLACSSGEMWLRGRDGRMVGEIEGHSQPIGGQAFIADGQELLTSASDRTIRRWRTDGASPLVHAVPDAVDACDFDATGERVAVRDARNDTAIYTRSGRKLFGPAPDKAVQTFYTSATEFFVGWSTLGDVLLTHVLGRRAPVFRTPEGGVAWQPAGKLAEWDDRHSLTWIPTRDQAFWADPQGARIYDRRGEVVATWPASPWQPGANLAWNATGQRVVRIGADGSLALWSAAGELLAELPVPKDQGDSVPRVLWSRDGARLTRALLRSEGGALRSAGPTQAWDRDGKPLPDEVPGLIGWNADGTRRLAYAEDGDLRILDAEGGEVARLAGDGSPERVFVSSAGQHLLVRYSTGAEWVWSWSGTRIADVASPRGQTTAVCWDPREELLVLGTSTGDLRYLPFTDELLLARARQLAPGGLTEAQSARYLQRP